MFSFLGVLPILSWNSPLCNYESYESKYEQQGTDKHEFFVEAFVYILSIQEKMVEERDTSW